MLLNGVAERVVFVEGDISRDVDPAQTAGSFRFEKQPVCPPVNQFENLNRLMQIEIAKGNCLVFSRVPLSVAEIVFSVGNVKRGNSPGVAGFSLVSDTVAADSIIVHEKRDGVYVETFRKTLITMERLAPLFFPTAVEIGGLKFAPGLLRYSKKFNCDPPCYGGLNLSGFLSQRFGYDLALHDGNAVEDMRRVLDKALNTSAADRSVPTQVAEQFFWTFSEAKKIEGDDLALARRLLEDSRFPMPGHAYGAVRYAKNVSADYFDGIGIAMFARLRRIAATDNGAKYPEWRNEVSQISSVINELPRETILRHRDDLDWLADHARLRAHSYAALWRYSEFGPEVAPELLKLIDAGRYAAGAVLEDWKGPYFAGMGGLCRLGKDGAQMIQPIFDRIDAGVLANWSNYNDLVIRTLVALGAEPENIWRHARESGYNSEPDDKKARAHFDRKIAGAQRREASRALGKVDCGY